MASLADIAKLFVSLGSTGVATKEIYEFYKRRQIAVSPVEDVVFPTDLLTEKDSTRDLFFIKFSFKKYEKRSQSKAGVIKNNGPGIKLPIPKALRDNLSVHYDSPSLGSTVGVMTDIIAENPLLLERGIREPTLLPQIPQLPEIRGGSLQALGAAPAIDQWFADSSVGRALQSLAGIAPNPYQTWLFKYPNFRNHTFNWTLSAESPEESEKIKEIIYYFQINMLPTKENNNNSLLFGYPSLVLPQLFAGNRENIYLYEFKPCVLKSVSVDYASAGKPAFFTSNNQRGVSGAPAAVSLSIDLQEIEFWTADDIRR